LSHKHYYEEQRVSRESECQIIIHEEDDSRSASFFAFDTLIDIRARPQEHMHADELENTLREIYHRCEFFEHTFSRTRPDSDISRINRAGGKPVNVAYETADLVEKALGYCAKSNGAFDITMGTVCALWNFKEHHVPTDEQLVRALPHVDFNGIQVYKEDNRTYTIQLDDPEAMIDVGGIAKGYIADDLAALLRCHGIQNGIINLGGNVMTLGTRATGDPWRVGIRDPHHLDQIIVALPVSNLSVVTSGLYERCFYQDKTLYHHILSATDGKPVQTDLASATIISEKSLDGDGYSTTLFMLGMEGALSFIASHDAIEGLLIDTQGSIRMSPGLEAHR
jgi:FAD:protein FMN transferase